MSIISIQCNVTEFAVIPNEDYQTVLFCLNNESFIISFMDNVDRVLTQSEISREDAIKLAKLILHKYETI